MNAVVEFKHPQSTTFGMLDNFETIEKMQALAGIMSQAAIAVPNHLRGKPGDCLAIVMQAAQWQMNPYAVAQKTHVVNGSLGYEAQLVNAVVSSSSLLVGRLNYTWEGDWAKVNGKSDDSEARACTVSGVIKGESEPRTLRVSMAQVGTVRNSPLWVNDPRQQLAYLATKRWVRLHAPDVLLGVYTDDELYEIPKEKDITPSKIDQFKRNTAPVYQEQAISIDSAEIVRAMETAQTIEVLEELRVDARQLSGDELKAAQIAYKLAKKRITQPKPVEDTFATLIMFCQSFNNEEEGLRASNAVISHHQAGDIDDSQRDLLFQVWEDRDNVLKAN